MFAPIGYVVGHDFVTSMHNHIIERMGPNNLTDTQRRVAVNILVGFLASFFRQCPSIAVYLPDQSLIRPSNKLFATKTMPGLNNEGAEPLLNDRMSFEYLTLPELMVSVPWAPTAPQPTLLHRIKATFDVSARRSLWIRSNPVHDLARLNGGYLVFQSQHLPQGEEPVLDLVLPDWRTRTSLVGSKQASTNVPSDLAAQIVALVDAGEVVIRDEVKARLAPDLNTEAWKEEWRAASRQRPALSKRGPKRTNKKGDAPQ